MKIQKTNNEFMLLPTFSIDNWYTPKLDAIIDIYKGENRCVTITKEEYENN